MRLHREAKALEWRFQVSPTGCPAWVLREARPGLRATCAAIPSGSTTAEAAHLRQLLVVRLQSFGQNPKPATECPGKRGQLGVSESQGDVGDSGACTLKQLTRPAESRITP